VIGIRLAHAITLRELVARFGGVADPALGDRAVERLVSAARLARQSDATDALCSRALVVWTSSRYALRALPQDAICLCAPPLAERIGAARWVHGHALWVVSELLRAVAPDREFRQHAAKPEPGGPIASDVIIEPGAVIHERVAIGPGSRIGANAVLYAGVELGRRVDIGAGAVIGRPGFGFTESPRGETVRVPHLGGVVIEDDVEVGANTTIDRPAIGETRIGSGTKIDNLVQIAHGVTIGRNVLLAAQVGVAGSTTVEDGVTLAGQVGVAGHLTIGRGTIATAQSGIPNSLDPGSFVSGYPAISNREWLKASAVFRRLPALRKTVADLEQRIAELEKKLESS
jgi:acyl-[acyl carrier protein]--UDP-N-acetylglucosamine O-acyltransferase